MVTSPGGDSTGTGTTSGSGPAPAAPSVPDAGPSIPGGALGPVDTGIIDAASDRYHQVGEQIKALAARALVLANYSPTFSGAPDKAWNAFITNGYGGAAQGTSDALRGTALAVAALADTSKQLSTLFTRTEQQNEHIAGQLASAFQERPASDSSSSSDGETTTRDAAPIAATRRATAVAGVRAKKPMVRTAVAGVREQAQSAGAAPSESLPVEPGVPGVPGVRPSAVGDAEPTRPGERLLGRAVQTSLPAVPVESGVRPSAVGDAEPTRPGERLLGRAVQTSLPAVPVEPGVRPSAVRDAEPTRPAQQLDASAEGVVVASTPSEVELPLQSLDAVDPAASSEAPTAVRDLETTAGSSGS